MQGYYNTKLKMYERAMLLAGALCMIKSGLLTDAIGFGLLALVYLVQKKRAHTQKAAA